jgi:hypothetical protein
MLGAHSPSVRKVMAHSKSATMAYARDRGVDLWNEDPVHTLCPLTSKLLLTVVTEFKGLPPEDSLNVPYVADVGDGVVVLAKLPQGVARTRARIPRLHFRSVDDTTFIRDFIAESIPAYEELNRRRPDDIGAVHRWAFLCIVGRRYQEARRLYEWLDRADPDNGGVIEKLALCQEVLGDTAAAEQTLARALAVAQATGNQRLATRVAMRMDWLRSPGAHRTAAPLRTTAPGP